MQRIRLFTTQQPLVTLVSVLRTLCFLLRLLETAALTRHPLAISCKLKSLSVMCLLYSIPIAPGYFALLASNNSPSASTGLTYRVLLMPLMVQHPMILPLLLWALKDL